MPDIQARVEKMLAQHGLALEESALKSLCDAIELAGELAATPLRPRLRKRAALKQWRLAHAALANVEALSREEAETARRRRWEALIALKNPASPGPDPSGRDWVGPCCQMFLEAYPGRKAAWKWDDNRTPALEFLTSCCELVDANLNESAVIEAMKRDHFADENLSGLERDEAYRARWADLEEFEQILLKPTM